MIEWKVRTRAQDCPLISADLTQPVLCLQKHLPISSHRIYIVPHSFTNFWSESLPRHNGERQRQQDLCEFEASLDYLMSWKIARAMLRDSVSI